MCHVNGRLGGVFEEPAHPEDVRQSIQALKDTPLPALRPLPATLLPLNSKDVWALNSISLNINGLNHPPMAMYERHISKYQLVAFQETKFVKPDSIQTNEHFIFSTDSGAQCVWSDTTSPVFNERHGVGLVLSSASPFQDTQDSTPSV